MADKKSKAAEAAPEEIVYAPEATTPVVVVESSDATKLNTLSVVSIASSVTGFGAVAGVVTGHVALAQLRRSGEKGRGLAIAGLITGYLGVAGFVLMSALAVGGHWAQGRGDDNRGFMGNSQQFGGHFGGRGQDDQGFFGMGGAQNGQNGQIQGQGGNVQVVPNGSGQVGQGGVTIDSNGNSTITLPNGQTITLPGDGGMMRGPGMMGGQGQFGQGPSGQGQLGQVPSGTQGN